ncbi:hypothetical protein R1flu_001171 [Riccia fluitans]|uniref:Uncharacterized protein n=1 Tax=Riccia fluitans TaxID=41844 RepID=A0ABD1Y2I2_9MARC
MPIQGDRRKELPEGRRCPNAALGDTEYRKSDQDGQGRGSQRKDSEEGTLPYIGTKSSRNQDSEHTTSLKAQQNFKCCIQDARKRKSTRITLPVSESLKCRSGKQGRKIIIKAVGKVKLRKIFVSSSLSDQNEDAEKPLCYDSNGLKGRRKSASICRMSAEQYYILEPFHTLSYQGLEYLESCLSFESILDKLETAGEDPSQSRSRAVALRLLLRLPTQLPGELQGSPTSSGNRTIHSRVHLSAKGKHYRVLTPRCDTTIVQQLGRNSAVVLLQKFLRGRAKMISMEKTKGRWEESYDELNGFHHCYKPKGMRSGMDLDTTITEKVIVRTLIGDFLGVTLEPLVISTPTSTPKTGKRRTTVKSR